jgi:restriction system protein
VANRDGVPPIELIDGERFVSLFEKYELGLKPKTVYELIPEFSGALSVERGACAE